MNFTTHTHAAINTQGTRYIGHIKAKHSELESVFGTAAPGNGDTSDAHWSIQFDDGLIATIYNHNDGPRHGGPAVKKIDRWHVGGTHQSVCDRVQIAIDLYREAMAEKKAEEEVNGVPKGFITARDMFRNIVANKGEDFARMVEVASLARKQHELLFFALSLNDDIPESVMKHFQEASQHVCAMLINAAVKASTMEPTKDNAVELMGWVDRLHECERAGGDEILSRAMKSRKEK